MSSRLNPSVQYKIGAGDRNKTKFDFNFPIIKSDDVKVVMGDGQILSAYSVSINSNKDGGYVQFSSPFSVGSRVTIYREMIFSRQTLFRENEDFHASVINEEFDRVIMLLQQAGKASKDSLRQARYDVEMDMVLPSAEQRADKLLGFDNSGRPKVLFDPSETAKEAKIFSESAKKDADFAAQNRNFIEQKIQVLKMDHLAKLDASNVDILAYKNKLNLGTASERSVGNKAGEIPVLDTDNKLPKSVYSSVSLSTKIFAQTSGMFFVRTASGSLPTGIVKANVWSLADQETTFGGTAPNGKIHIELPAGLVYFVANGAGGSGSSGNTQGGNDGGDTSIGKIIAKGGAGGADRSYNSTHRPALSGGSGGSIHIAKGSKGGGSGVFNKYPKSDFTGGDGGKVSKTINMIVGQVIPFNIGSGGAPVNNIYHYPSVAGENGSVEVEYVV